MGVEEMPSHLMLWKHRPQFRGCRKMMMKKSHEMKTSSFVRSVTGSHWRVSSMWTTHSQILVQTSDTGNEYRTELRENEAKELEESELKDTERMFWMFVSLAPSSEVPGFALGFKILFSIL